VYYNSKLVSLSADTDTNWVSESYPDAYVFGLVVEICAFAKDAEGAAAWSARFNEVIGQMIDGDGRRWIGPAPIIQLG
jgi:hypothetical protein